MKHSWPRYLPGTLRSGLEGHRSLQKILPNTGWLVADRILRMGVGLLVGVWVARYLGPEQFGVFNYALAFAALFGVLGSLGLDGIVVRDIVRNPSAGDEVLGTAFVLRLLGGILALGVATTAIFLMRPGDPLIHGMVAITASRMIFQAFDAIDFWFQSQVQSKYTVFAKNGAFLIIALVKVGLILHKAPLIAFVWAGLAETILGALGLVLVYRLHRLSPSAWRPNRAQAGILLRDSWPLILSGLAIAVYMKIDQIMLGEMLGNEAVGLYSAGIRVSEIWYFIPMAIVTSVSPSLIEAKKSGEDAYYRKMEKLFHLLAAISLVIAIPMTFLSKYVITFLYGARYVGAGSVLSIHIWTAIFVSLGVAQGTWILNEGLMRISLQRTVIGAVANVLLNLALIPRIGVIGAAVATLVAQALSSCLMNLFDRRTQRIFQMQLRALFPVRYLRKVISG